MSKSRAIITEKVKWTTDIVFAWGQFDNHFLRSYQNKLTRFKIITALYSELS
jgi:hypothetical protein